MTTYRLTHPSEDRYYLFTESETPNRILIESMGFKHGEKMNSSMMITIARQFWKKKIREGWIGTVQPDSGQKSREAAQATKRINKKIKEYAESYEYDAEPISKIIEKAFKPMKEKSSWKETYPYEKKLDRRDNHNYPLDA